MTTIVRCMLRVVLAFFLLSGTILSWVIDDHATATVSAGMILFLMIVWSALELAHEKLPYPRHCAHGDLWDNCPDCRH